MGRVQGLQSNQRPPLFQGTLHQSHSSQAHRGTDTRAHTPASADKCKRPPSFFPSTTHPLRSALKSSALGHSAQGRFEFLGLLFSLFVFIKPLPLRFFPLNTCWVQLNCNLRKVEILFAFFVCSHNPYLSTQNYSQSSLNIPVSNP